MSITDELRKAADDIASTAVPCGASPDYIGVRRKIDAIADRIDAEHEMATSEFWAKINAVPVTDENMSEHGWIRLPKDADGEYIHIGDVMAYADNTKPMEVVALVPPAVFLTEDGPRYADMCRHYHAPTVEDVLREFVNEFNRDDTELCDEEIIERFAARLRLAEGEDA